MPNIKSAIKRVNINKTKSAQNTALKSALKTSIKKCKAAIEGGTASGAVFNDTVSAIDKAAAKKLIHKNTAARRKSKLARALAKAKAV